MIEGQIETRDSGAHITRNAFRYRSACAGRHSNFFTCALGCREFDASFRLHNSTIEFRTAGIGKELLLDETKAEETPT